MPGEHHNFSFATLQAAAAQWGRLLRRVLNVVNT